MKNKNTKKLLSLILSLTMIIGLFPANAFAKDNADDSKIENKRFNYVEQPADVSGDIGDELKVTFKINKKAEKVILQRRIKRFVFEDVTEIKNVPANTETEISVGVKDEEYSATYRLVSVVKGKHGNKYEHDSDRFKATWKDPEGIPAPEAEKFDIKVTDGAAFNEDDKLISKAEKDDVVILKAVNPDPENKYFGGWTSEDVVIDDANKENDASFVMPDKNVNIVANYKDKVHFTKVPSNLEAVMGEDINIVFAVDKVPDNIIIQQKFDENYIDLVNFKDIGREMPANEDISVVINNSNVVIANTYRVAAVIDGVVTVTPDFTFAWNEPVIVEHAINVENGEAYIGENKVAVAEKDAVITLKAINPDPENKYFAGWTSDGVVINEAEKEIGANFVMPDADVNIKANYKDKVHFTKVPSDIEAVMGENINMVFAVDKVPDNIIIQRKSGENYIDVSNFKNIGREMPANEDISVVINNANIAVANTYRVVAVIDGVETVTPDFTFKWVEPAPPVIVEHAIKVENGEAYIAENKVDKAQKDAVVTLKGVNPDNKNKHFDHWEGSENVVIKDADKESGATFVMPDGDAVIKAVYEDNFRFIKQPESAEGFINESLEIRFTVNQKPDKVILQYEKDGKFVDYMEFAALKLNVNANEEFVTHFNSETPVSVTYRISVEYDGNRYDSNKFVLKWNDLAAVKEVNINVDAPKYKAEPAKPVANAKEYAIKDFSWMPEDSTFKAGTAYGIIVNLNTNRGFKFTDKTVFKINGKEAAVSGLENGFAKVSLVFPKTAGEAKPAPVENKFNWYPIREAITKAKAGDKLRFNVNSEIAVPHYVWQALYGKDVTVTLQRGQDKFNFNGLDLKKSGFKPDTGHNLTDLLAYIGKTYNKPAPEPVKPVEPAIKPDVKPSAEPSATPKPTVEPTREPDVKPTEAPEVEDVIDQEGEGGFSLWWIVLPIGVVILIVLFMKKRKNLNDDE